MSLFLRVFVVNGVLVVIAALLLLLTPATVSPTARVGETVLLTGGVTIVLVLNFILLRHAFGDLQRLAAFIRGVDAQRPGERAPTDSSSREVADLSRTFNAMLERLEVERRDSSARAIAAQERERHRVALELHDEVGQTLTGLVLQLTSAATLADEPLRQRIVEAQETARDGVEAVRDIARGLRPEALDDFGLRPALVTLASTLADRAQIRVRRRLPDDLPPLTPEKELVVYRVAQEALTNVARHARAHEVVLGVSVDAGRLDLTVTDDGRGFSDAPGGAGLAGMRERALLASGTLEVRSQPGSGTEVRLRLPL